MKNKDIIKDALVMATIISVDGNPSAEQVDYYIRRMKAVLSDWSEKTVPEAQRSKGFSIELSSDLDNIFNADAELGWPMPYIELMTLEVAAEAAFGTNAIDPVIRDHIKRKLNAQRAKLFRDKELLPRSQVDPSLMAISRAGKGWRKSGSGGSFKDG